MGFYIIYLRTYCKKDLYYFSLSWLGLCCWEEVFEPIIVLCVCLLFDWGKCMPLGRSRCSSGLPRKTKEWSMITTSRHLKHYIFLCNPTKSSLPIPQFSIIQSRLHIYYVSEWNYQVPILEFALHGFDFSMVWDH